MYDLNFVQSRGVSNPEPPPSGGDPPPPPPPMPSRGIAQHPDPELRKMRERSRAMSDALDRRRITGPPQTAREFVQVIDGGNFPTEPGRVFWTNPVEIDADDVEGASPTFSADTDQVIPVVFIRKAPSVSDYAVAHSVAGRWVAENGGECKPVRICVAACTAPPELLHGTVTVKDPDTGDVVASGTATTTNCVTFDLVPGPYDITISGTKYPDITYHAQNLSCGTVWNGTVNPPQDFVCCQGIPSKPKIYGTDFDGTFPLVFDDTLGYWVGQHIVAVPDKVITARCNPGPGIRACQVATAQALLNYAVKCLGPNNGGPPTGPPQLQVTMTALFGDYGGATASGGCPPGPWLAYGPGFIDGYTAALSGFTGNATDGYAFVLGQGDSSTLIASEAVAPSSTMPLSWHGTLEVTSGIDGAVLIPNFDFALSD